MDFDEIDEDELLDLGIYDPKISLDEKAKLLYNHGASYEEICSVLYSSTDHNLSVIGVAKSLHNFGADCSQIPEAFTRFCLTPYSGLCEGEYSYSYKDLTKALKTLDYSPREIMTSLTRSFPVDYNLDSYYSELDLNHLEEILFSLGVTDFNELVTELQCIGFRKQDIKIHLREIGHYPGRIFAEPI
ncbi:hypothetical protein HOE04_02455 [archaeon]|jgi:hypothetical protein|nr:hypothetical protein [archaeon]